LVSFFENSLTSSETYYCGIRRENRQLLIGKRLPGIAGVGPHRRGDNRRPASAKLIRIFYACSHWKTSIILPQ
jgi:hypothetical protein